jgi:hypothetical protein
MKQYIDMSKYQIASEREGEVDHDVVPHFCVLGKQYFNAWKGRIRGIKREG